LEPEEQLQVREGELEPEVVARLEFPLEDES
jgi:hypothetical protein